MKTVVSSLSRAEVFVLETAMRQGKDAVANLLNGNKLYAKSTIYNTIKLLQKRGYLDKDYKSLVKGKSLFEENKVSGRVTNRIKEQSYNDFALHQINLAIK